MNNINLTDTLFFKHENIDGKQLDVCIVNYFSFLDLSGDDLEKGLYELKLLTTRSDIIDQLLVLLNSKNWRAHILCLPYLFWLPQSNRLTHALWAAIKNGSWCFPQILATLSETDEEFEQRLSKLTSWCKENSQSEDIQLKIRANKLQRFIEAAFVKTINSVDKPTDNLIDLFNIWKGSAKEKILSI